MFKLDNIKLTKSTKKETFSSFGKVINCNNILSDNIKHALWLYVKYRMFILRHHSFTTERFALMIDEMLEHLIGKNIKEITAIDVGINENQIIYEIANSIYYRSLFHLYRSADLSYKIERKLENAPKPILNNKRMNNEELEDYFKGIMV